jgi:triphosphatase
MTVLLQPFMTADYALRVILIGCLTPILQNARAIASGKCNDEHIHQLRVNMRRFRSALRFFEGMATPLDPAWTAPLDDMFRKLGEARDRDVLNATLLPALKAVGAPEVLLPPVPSRADLADALKSEPVRKALENILVWLQTTHASPEEAPLLHQVSERLEKWHNRILRDGHQFSSLQDAERHALRKLIKRMRYATEFTAPLFPAKAVGRYLEHLKPLQDSLGLYADLCVALALFQGLLNEQPHAEFAVGWLSAQRDSQRVRCAAQLDRLPKIRPYW